MQRLYRALQLQAVAPPLPRLGQRTIVDGSWEPADGVILGRRRRMATNDKVEYIVMRAMVGAQLKVWSHVK